MEIISGSIVIVELTAYVFLLVKIFKSFGKKASKQPITGKDYYLLRGTRKQNIGVLQNQLNIY